MTDKIPINILSEYKFNHIIHIGDIHLRPHKRHEEYKLVFETLCDEISKLKASKLKCIIVICGDTFDHKTSYSPSMYDICINFFIKMASFFPIVCIPGNHDFIDLSHLDTLTPITHLLNNFYYLKKSGAYQIGDVVFSTTSLYDSTYNFIKRNQIDTNKICICLYHGTLNGSKDDSGYIFKNSGANSRFRKLSDIEGYDACLLGDIHRMQSLTPTCYYSGSLIQQTYAESMKNHGYLKWSIANKNNIQVTFHEIVNSYGHVTIHVSDNKWTNTEIQFPQKSNIRLIISNTIESKKQEIIDLIKSKTEIQDLRTISNDKIIPTFESMTNKTIKSTDVILDELKKLDYPQAKKNELTELHKNYMKKIDLQDNAHGMYLWYPISLEFKNLFGYAGNYLNKIEFKTGVTSITAANASGKTSILNIIFYTLFNDLLLNPGRTKNADIINNKEKQGYVKLVIQYGTTVYIIEKEINRTKNNQIEIHHKLTYTEDNKQITIEQKLATDKLKDLFGTLQDMYRCNVLNNRDQSNDFFRMTDGEKIKYLKQSFNLDHFDDLLTINKDVIKKNKLILTEKETKYNLLNDEVSQLIKNDENYEENFNKQLDQLLEDNITIETELKQLNDQYNTIYKSITLKENEIIPLNLHETNIKEEMKTINKKYPDFTQVYDLEKLKHDIITQKSQLNNSIDFTNEELTEKLTNITTQLSKLTKIKITQNKDLIYKTMIQLESNKNQLDKEINVLNDKLKRIVLPKKKKVIKTTNEINNEIEQLNKLYKEPSDLTEEEIKEQIDHYSNKITDSTQQLSLEEILIKKTGLQKDLDSINKQISQIKITNNQSKECDLEYNDIQRYIDILKQTIKPLHSIETKHNINQVNYKKNINELKTIEININQLLQKTISNDNIDTYTNQLSQLLNKDKLLAKEYQSIKVNLFTPLKDLLIEIKKDTFNIDREKLKMLSDRKNILIQEVNNIKHQIEFNNNINNLIKENDSIREQNNDIQTQIILYENHYKYMTLNLLKDQKQLLVNKIEELTDLSELNKYQILFDNHIHNKNLDKQITTLKDMKKMIEYNDIQTSLTVKQTELETVTKQYVQYTRKYRFVTLMEEKESYEYQLKCLNNNDLIKQQIDELTNKISYENQRRKYNDNQKNLDIIYNNSLLKNEIKYLTKKFEEIKNQQNEKQQQNVKTRIQIDSMQKKIDKINHNNQELNNLKNDIIKKQLEIQLLELYGNLVSPKGLQTTIIKRELKKLETSMNEILSKYTKYSIDINYDTDKSNIEILTKTDTNEKLSIERLSTYETIILTTAFKRSIGKHVNRTRSMLYIIDESLENLDQTNFDKVLPELLKLIMEEYSYILIISQRDISHVSDNEIKIEKINNISRIM